MRTLVDISLAVALAAATLLGGLADPAWSAWSAEQGEKAKQAEPKNPASTEAGKRNLSASEYVTLKPFVIPLIEKGKFNRRQFVLVLALKLTYEEARDKVVSRTPKIRDALYPALYRLISFRRGKRRMTDKKRLREKLSTVALAQVSGELVSGLVVHRAYVKRAP